MHNKQARALVNTQHAVRKRAANLWWPPARPACYLCSPCSGRPHRWPCHSRRPLPRQWRASACGLCKHVSLPAARSCAHPYCWCGTAATLDEHRTTSVHCRGVRARFGGSMAAARPLMPHPKCRHLTVTGSVRAVFTKCHRSQGMAVQLYRCVGLMLLSRVCCCCSWRWLQFLHQCRWNNLLILRDLLGGLTAQGVLLLQSCCAPGLSTCSTAQQGGADPCSAEPVNLNYAHLGRTKNLLAGDASIRTRWHDQWCLEESMYILARWPKSRSEPLRQGTAKVLNKSQGTGRPCALASTKHMFVCTNLPFVGATDARVWGPLPSSLLPLPLSIQGLLQARTKRSRWRLSVTSVETISIQQWKLIKNFWEIIMWSVITLFMSLETERSE